MNVSASDWLLGDEVNDDDGVEEADSHTGLNTRFHWTNKLPGLSINTIVFTRLLLPCCYGPQMISFVDKFCFCSSDNDITLAICFNYFTGDNCLGKVAHLVWNFPGYRNTIANYPEILSRDLYFLKFQLLIRSPLFYLLLIWKKAFFLYKLPSTAVHLSPF